MGRQYRLGEDDNVVDAYGVRFTVIEHTHYLDEPRIKHFEREIEIGRLIPTGAPEIDDALLGLPDINLYLINNGNSGGCDIDIDVDHILYNTASDTNIKTVRDALDKLLYVPIQINSFSNSNPQLERGQVITSLTLNWALNKGVITQKLNGSIITNTLRTYVINSTINSNTSFTLEVSDDKNSTSRSTSVSFFSKRFYGVNSKESLTSADILTLNGELSTSRGQSRVFNCSGQYIYIAYPQSFGAATFKVNGLSSTAWEESAINVTNQYGFTETYRVYRSTYLQNGSGIAVDIT